MYSKRAILEIAHCWPEIRIITDSFYMFDCWKIDATQMSVAQHHLWQYTCRYRPASAYVHPYPAIRVETTHGILVFHFIILVLTRSPSTITRGTTKIHVVQWSGAGRYDDVLTNLTCISVYYTVMIILFKYRWKFAG